MLARTRIFAIACAIAVCVALGSCTTPSVPIPPPSPEDMNFDIDVDLGTASFTYEPFISYANAVVYIFNEDAGSGIITVADDRGAVGPTEPVIAREGDKMIITFEVDTQLASTCVFLRNGQQSSGDRCD